jgi:nucleotide-binding universal stress UspA family protein
MPKAPIERIICPTDFSEFSAQALRHAIALARVFKARLKVVHVVPHVFGEGVSLYGAAPWLVTPELRSRAEDDLRAFLAPVREGRLNHEFEVREGDPWREILDAAAEMPADFAVMGTHGRGGLDRYLLGSVAEKLVRKLPCPVMTVAHEEGRTWEAPGLVTRVLCATDFSKPSADALEMAVSIAEAFRADITLLHTIESFPDFGDPTNLALMDVRPLREDVERSARASLETLARKARSSRVNVEAKITFGRAYKDILRTAAEDRADLILIGAQGHGFVEHLLAGSNAQHVIRRATCPVITVRPTEMERRDETQPHSLALASSETPIH